MYITSLEKIIGSNQRMYSKLSECFTESMFNVAIELVPVTTAKFGSCERDDSTCKMKRCVPTAGAAQHSKVRRRCRPTLQVR